MLSCPHPLTPCLGRECERARTSIYTHTYTHTRSISVHVHNRSEMVLQRNSFYACTSPVGTLENSFQRRLSEMPARLYTITVDCWKLSPDRFSWNRCPIILSSRATRKTTCYALFGAFFFSFFFFSTENIRSIFVQPPPSFNAIPDILPNPLLFGTIAIFRLSLLLNFTLLKNKLR